MDAIIPTTAATKLILNTGTICFSGVLMYLGLHEETFAIFSGLLFFDYITGVWKAKALGHSITSNKMKYGVISKFSLILIPIVMALGAKALTADFKDVLFVGMNILVLSEVYSILGNIYSIRTRQEMPEYDAVVMIGKRIRGVLIKFSEEK